MNKKFFEDFGKGFTFMIVPNSSGEIRSWIIPFSAILVVVGIILFNAYVFISFTAQIWQIKKIHTEITTKNRQISKLVSQQQAVKPNLQKSDQMIYILNQMKNDRERIEKAWGALSGSSSSKPRSQQPYIMRSGGEEISDLEALNQNLDQLTDYVAVEKELQKNLLGNLRLSEKKLAHIPTDWPLKVSIISSWFGWRVHPVLGYSRKHEGIDLKAKIGTKVYASASGTIKFAGWQSGYGNLVIIEHDNGYETRYGHNSRILVFKGQKVRKGQVICLSGNTGVSSGPHLHFEIRLNKRAINPTTFLNK